MMASMGKLTVIGLAFDVVGVILLALSFLGAKTRQMVTMAGAAWGGNKVVFGSLMLQRTDARFGLPLLVAGFAIQAIGSYCQGRGCALLSADSAKWFYIFLVPYALFYVYRRYYVSLLFDRLYRELHPDDE